MDEADFDQMEYDHLDRIFQDIYACLDCGHSWMFDEYVCPKCESHDVERLTNKEE
jgi:ribosomal protein L37AE/L43A